MDADARRRMAALEQELQRLQQEVDSLRSSLPDEQEQPAPPSSFHEQPPPFPLDARWLALGGLAVLTVALLLFMRDAAQWLAPAFQLATAAAIAFALWGVGIFVHGRFAPALAGSGVVIAALVAGVAHVAVGWQATALALALLAVAAVVDGGLRHVQSQAVLGALLVYVAAAAGLAWPPFSLFFALAMAVALLAMAAWHRFGGLPIVVALGTGSILVMHAYAGAEPGAVFGAALLLWGAFAAMAWMAPREPDLVCHCVVWLVAWGMGAWALAGWGVASGWWTLALGMVALRLGFAPAPQLMRRMWHGLAFVAFVAFPIHLPWPRIVAAAWLVQLALVLLYRLRRDHPAVRAAAAVLTAAVVLRLLSYEAPRIENTAALAIWLAATALFAASWFAARRRDILARIHLGAATGGLLLLIALLLPSPAVGFVWIAVAAALVAEGMALRRLDLRVAGMAAFGAAIFRLGFDLFELHSIWSSLAFTGVGVLLLSAAWLWWGRNAPAEAQ